MPASCAWPASPAKENPVEPGKTSGRAETCPPELRKKVNLNPLRLIYQTQGMRVFLLFWTGQVFSLLGLP
jgi:hypothetical protein